MDFYATVTRQNFEELCESLFFKAMGPLQSVLQDAGLDRSKVDEIVLVGGSTRIPMIQQMVSNFFD